MGVVWCVDVVGYEESLVEFLCMCFVIVVVVVDDGSCLFWFRRWWKFVVVCDIGEVRMLENEGVGGEEFDILEFEGWCFVWICWYIVWVLLMLIVICNGGWMEFVLIVVLNLEFLFNCCVLFF